jgi:membrane fusion protein, multidrug efflux system
MNRFKLHPMNPSTALHAAVVVAGFALFAATGCSHPEAKPAPQPLPTATVQVRAVQSSTEGGALQAIGRIKNVRESTITARAMGKVLRVAVKAGDAVRAGQLLVKIDDADASGRVSQARGALAQAQAAKVIARQNLDRFEKLRDQASASDAKYEKAVFDFQSATGAVEQAEGAVKTAEAYLRETTITAPFDGQIVDTLVEEGETAAPGQPVVRIEGGQDLEFEAAVNAADIAGVATGQGVLVVLDGAAGAAIELPGTVSEIVPAQDAVTHTSLVRIALKAPSKAKPAAPDAEKAAGQAASAAFDRVRSGMFGRVRFAVGVKSCPSVMVPSSLVRRRGQLSALYVVDDSPAVRLRLVTEGATRGEETEILSGLADGDRLVVSDTSKLIDGQPAQISTGATATEPAK